MSGEDLPLLPSLIGATSSGKTSLAIAVARALAAAGGPAVEILSADSRQVYRRFDAGTAKPTAEERAAVPHHLIDVADPGERYTAARFGREARAAAAGARARGALPFLVGGSGLYLRAAEEGLFEGPEADAVLRERLTDEAEAAGDDALHARLAAVDPETAARLHAADRVRVIRALEVWELTGVPLSEHHRRHRTEAAAFRLLRFGIEWPAERLERRIRERVDAMVAAGWESEVERLIDEGVPQDAPAWNALGYPEVRARVEGKLGEDEMRERIVVATRKFAKRQRTWFRAVDGVTWLRGAGAADLGEAGRVVADALRHASEATRHRS
jgi:tRNA dimethylallyltransferase